MQYCEATTADVPAMAAVRAARYETQAYWIERITAYMNCELHPQKALLPRVLYVAIEDKNVVGLIAGHLTERFKCDGELEWIDVIPSHQRKGIASELMHLMAAWFVEQKAFCICVNCASDNLPAHRFYKSNGAEDLSEHWLVWKDISVALKG